VTSAGHAPETSYSCLRAMYVLQSTKEAHELLRTP
jgi:hypothetical protein